jgi:O-antigen ligase
MESSSLGRGRAVAGEAAGRESSGPGEPGWAVHARNVAGRLCLGALAALCSAPFLVSRHALPIVSFDSEWLAFLLAWLFAASVFVAVLARAKGQSDRSLCPGTPVAVLFPMGLLVALLVQMLSFACVHRAAADWSNGALAGLHEPLGVLMAMINALALLGVIVAGHWAARAWGIQRLCTVIAAALLAGGLLSVCSELVQALRLDAQLQPWVSPMVDITERRLYGNLAQPNHLGTYLSWGCAAILLISSRGGRTGSGAQGWVRLTACGVLLLVFFWGLAATGSRTGVAQVLCLVGAAAIVKPEGSGRPRQVVTAACIALLAVVAFTTMAWANRRFGLALSGSGAQRVVTGEGDGFRLALARTALDIWRDHVWVGAGWGEMPTEFLARAGSYGVAEPANSAHDFVLDLLAQTGVVGLLLTCLPVIGWVMDQVNGITRLDPEHRERGFAVLTVLLLTVHALLEFPQNFSYFLMPVGVLMGATSRGAALRPGISRAQALDSYRSARNQLGLLLLLGCVLLAAARVDYARAQMAFRLFGGYTYLVRPAVLFANYGELAMTLQEPIGGDDLLAELRDTQEALHLSIAPELLEREVVLLALAGRQADEQREARRLWYVASRHRLESKTRLDAMFARAGIRQRWDGLVVPDRSAAFTTAAVQR